MSATTPRFSLVLPIHDDEALLASTLPELARAFPPSDAEIVVACNGCRDDSAAVARSVEGVTVIELDRASKVAALNAADMTATSFPRVYLDVDVRVDHAAIRAVVDRLRSGDVHAAAPRLHVDVSKSSRLVASYYRIWSRLPWVRDEMVGSGFYALTAEGRGRFTDFPDEGADDLWVSAHFGPGERQVVDGVSFSVDASRTIRQVVRRKARVLAANRRIAPLTTDLPGRSSNRAGAFSVVRDQPALLPHFVVYSIVTVTAELRARRMVRRDDRSWAGDRGSEPAR